LKDILGTKFKGKAYNKKPEAKKQWKKKPTPISEVSDKFEICRVLPFYAVQNYDYLEILPRPKRVAKDTQSYVLNLKSRINNLKNDLSNR
jgi:hypothetical protein